MRLFVGILPPPDVVAELDAAVRRLRRLPPSRDLRWTAREGWHLTLAFLGDVSEEDRPALDAALADAVGTAAGPLRLRVKGGGRFGSTAFWAGVDGDRRALARLAETVGDAAVPLGSAADSGHAFVPHLTLARTRGRTLANLRPLVDGLSGFTGRPWTADRVALVHSRPGEGRGGGPRYDPVAGYPLRERQPES